MPGVACPLDKATTFDCAPYTCEVAFGTCRGDCNASSECANGFVCDVPSRTCVPAPPVDTSSSGGGCAIDAGDPRSDVGLVTIAMALAIGAARRRSRRSLNSR
jgi:hypothetical protein